MTTLFLCHPCFLLFMSSPFFFCHTCEGRCPGLHSAFCVTEKREGITWIPAYAGTGLDSVLRRNDNLFSLSSPRRRGSRSAFCILFYKRRGLTWIPASAGMTTPFLSPCPLPVIPAEAGVHNPRILNLESRILNKSILYS